VHSTNSIDTWTRNSGRAIADYLHHGSSPELLFLAGLLGALGVGIAAKTYFRGTSARTTLASLAGNVGGAAWLLPIAAVFALYVFWMRPSLTNPDDPAPTTITVSEQVPTPLVPTGTKLPEWVKEKDRTTGNSRLVVVTGEFGGTPEEALAEGRAAAVALVRADFSASFPRAAGWQPSDSAASDAAIRRTFVEEVDRKTTTSGVPFRVYRSYDQVELSPTVRNKLFPLWRDELVNRRIWALGGLAGLLTLTFGTLATYFRLDQHTSGLYRRRLKFAAVSVIAAGGLAAATLL
jgi:hypothetical protein